MKFDSLRKLTLPLALIVALALALPGCGGGNHNLSLTQGNWSMAASSPIPGAAPFHIGGNLTQSGSSLSGTMYVIGSCIDPSQQQSFTGTVSHNNITLTSTADPAGDVINITGTGNAISFTGNYSITGGTCAPGASGTINADSVPSITGTWAGPLNDSSDPNASLSMALTQASTASADGTFAVSGTLTYSNSACESSGTISSGSLAGQYLVSFTATTNTGDTIDYAYGALNSVTSPTQISNGTYSTTCDGNTETPTFTKQ